jgi:diacylglycerol O-acyltransferase / wax synthase
VVERLAQARKEPALRVASALAVTIGRLPTRVLLPALHAQADSVDFAATAVPGLRGARHICGSLIEASYPLGPRLGCPMNLTAFGNDGRLDIGVALDPSVVTKPELLVECLKEAFDTFTPGTRATRRGSRPAR